jgi:MEDS: MEthanogen/methylotroph, DcmR Sensory domain
VSHPEGAFQHWVCIYDDDKQFLETAVPFLTEGLALGEPVLAVTTPANLELLGTALPDRSGDVDYADSAFFGRPRPRSGCSGSFVFRQRDPYPGPGQHCAHGARSARRAVFE